MARFTGYIGVTNYLGGKFSADTRAFSPVLAEIATRGLVYLDDGSSPRSLAARNRRELESAGGCRRRRDRRRADRRGDRSRARPAGGPGAAPGRRRRRRHRIADQHRAYRALGGDVGGPRNRARADIRGDSARARALRARPIPRVARDDRPMTQELPYRRSAGVALINRDGGVFIGRRKKSREDPELGGIEWQMPQGGIDEGETPLAGRAARALRGDQRFLRVADRRGARLAQLRPADGFRRTLARALSRPDAEMVPVPLRRRRGGDRHRPARRRRSRRRIPGLALGALGSVARADRAVQARSL